MMFKLIKHLLPDGKAWRLTYNSNLRELMLGISRVLQAARDKSDTLNSDLDPDKTTRLAEWESQFNLTPAALSDTDRRLKLKSAWGTMVGSLSKSYIQQVLNDNGFDVVVYDAYYGSDGSTPVWVNPNTLIRDSNTAAAAVLRSAGAKAISGGSRCVSGAKFDRIGYPLVNLITRQTKRYKAVAGGASAISGGSRCISGAYDGYTAVRAQYTVSNDPATYPFYLYVAGSDINTAANVPANRRAEFESLILKHKPAHYWAGVIVNYN